MPGFDSLIVNLAASTPVVIEDAGGDRGGKTNHAVSVDAGKPGDVDHIDHAQLGTPDQAAIDSALTTHSDPVLNAALSGYLPAKLLSLRPVVLKDINSDLVTVGDVPARSELIAQLLINEYGDVDRVIIDNDDLPASVLSELEQRFLHMRFSPGRLHGMAVRTALRIEVILQADLLH